LRLHRGDTQHTLREEAKKKFHEDGLDGMRGYNIDPSDAWEQVEDVICEYQYKHVMQK